MSENIIQRLPCGWSNADLYDMVTPEGIFIDGDWVESKDQNPDGDVRLIQLADIGVGEYKDKSNRFLTYEKAKELNCTFLQIGDVLIARMPEPLGRSCIFPGDIKKAVTVVDVCIVRLETQYLNNRWLMHILNSPQSRALIDNLQSGSTRKRISRGNLSHITFPLPPLPEQHRLVSKIEELFTKLDAGVEELHKIKTQLKHYRQAVLKAAFDGKLTEEWREAHQDELAPASVLLDKTINARKKNGNYKEISPIETADLTNLPESWVWARISDFGENEKYAIVDGPFGSNLKVSDYTPIGTVPVISISNIDEGFKSDNLRYITKEKYSTLARSTVRSGDIIVAKIGSSYGKVGYYPEGIPDGIIPANLLKMTVSKNLNRSFVYYFLKSSAFKKQLDSIMKSSAQPAFNVSLFRSLLIPMPSFEEQNMIAQAIEYLNSVTDEIESTVVTSLIQAERLRQSILKSAFEGKLVPQDPTDEPAEQLLERIKATRSKAGTKGRLTHAK